MQIDETISIQKLRCHIIEGFKSKRNQVFKVMIIDKEKPYTAVLKVFDEQEGAEKCKYEAETLKLLDAYNIAVPKVIAREERLLLLEFIDGSLLEELVEELKSGPWIEALALWLSKLHNIKNKACAFLKADVNLRNFIFSNGTIYGLDFEETGSGDPLDELAELCCFILLNKPALKKEKDKIIRELIANYEKFSGANIDDIAKLIWKAGRKIKQRRKKLLISF